MNSHTGKIDVCFENAEEEIGDIMLQDHLTFLQRTKADPEFEYYKDAIGCSRFLALSESYVYSPDQRWEGYHCDSQVTKQNLVELRGLLSHCGVGSVHISQPLINEKSYGPPFGFSPLYYHHVVDGGLRLPLDSFIRRVLEFYKVNLCQLTPVSMKRIIGFKLACIFKKTRPSVELFQCYHRVEVGASGYVYFTSRVDGDGRFFNGLYATPGNWEKKFAFVSVCIPECRRPWSHGFSNDDNDFVCPVRGTDLCQDYNCLQEFFKSCAIDTSFVHDNNLLCLLSILDQTVLCLKEIPMRYRSDAFDLFAQCEVSISKYVVPGVVPENSIRTNNVSSRMIVDRNAAFGYDPCYPTDLEVCSSASYVSGPKVMLDEYMKSDEIVSKGKNKQKVDMFEETSNSNLVLSDTCIDWLRHCLPEDSKEHFRGLSIDGVTRALSFNMLQFVGLADLIIRQLERTRSLSSQVNQDCNHGFISADASDIRIDKLHTKMADLENALGQERLETRRWKLDATSWRVHAQALEAELSTFTSKLKRRKNIRLPS